MQPMNQALIFSVKYFFLCCKLPPTSSVAAYNKEKNIGGDVISKASDLFLRAYSLHHP